jgi:hypothetical protein
VPRQNLGDENAEALATAATLAVIAAPHPLTVTDLIDIVLCPQLAS